MNIKELDKKEETKIPDFRTDKHLSVEVRNFLNVANKGIPIESLTVKEAQDSLVKAQKSVEVDLSGIEVTEKVINANGTDIKLNIVRPSGNKNKLPVFIFIHGGGWVLGDFQTHERLVRDLVVLSDMACVFVNYTRTPEAQYPKALHEIYSVLEWVSTNANEINVNSNLIALAGNSAGANMVVATSLLSKEKNGPKIKFQLLMWPVVDANFDTESYMQFGEDRFLTTTAINWMFDMYIPDKSKRKDIYISPLQATIEQLKGLPPTLIQTAENDILRDEAETFGQKLDEAGVSVATARYNGTIHDFGLLNALAKLPETRAALSQAAMELRHYLR